MLSLYQREGDREAVEGLKYTTIILALIAEIIKSFCRNAEKSCRNARKSAKTIIIYVKKIYLDFRDYLWYCFVLKGGLDMTKIISITMSIIIMLSAGLAVPLINNSPMTTITASAKTKTSPQKKKAKPKKKKKHVHYMPKGNMGKWFKSKKALKNYVSKVMQEYNRQYENGEITWEEYVKRCPCGYEAWSCSCGKWTGNFKYNR